MDESWRIRSEIPSRRSTGGPALNRAPKLFYRTPKPKPLGAGDFSDVFGGPSRAVSGRRSSVGGSFYEEIFQVAETAAPARRTGRNLRAFSIPVEKNDEFYSDIFGNDRIGRTRHRSRKVKSISNSSGMSSEELSPLRSANGEDVEMNSFASRLRPVNVNVPCKWNSSTMKPAAAEHPKNKRWMPAAFSHNSPSGSENQYVESFAYKSSYQGFSSRNVSSPDTTNLKPNSFRVTKLAASDFDLESTSSDRSSLCQEWEDKDGFQGNDHDGNDRMQEQDDGEEEEVMSPYVIEIKSDHYREGNDDAIDEAVAWVKERYQKHNPEKDTNTQERTRECVKTEHSSIPIITEDEELDKWTTEAKQQAQKDMKLKLLEKEVELWSSGKKSNIRLLLSSLHQILWPDSSWHAVPLTNIINRSRVKKAYKKAQLCLHPDKVQQRGATPTQKYVAAKVFVILQDAWDAFIAQDVLLVRG